jgi:hypothetical protein
VALAVGADDLAEQVGDPYETEIARFWGLPVDN